MQSNQQMYFIHSYHHYSNMRGWHKRPRSEEDAVCPHGVQQCSERDKADTQLPSHYRVGSEAVGLRARDRDSTERGVINVGRFQGRLARGHDNLVEF